MAEELGRLRPGERRAQDRIGGDRPAIPRRSLGLTIASVLALVAAAIWPPAPVLVWNASASSPLGLYGVSRPRALRQGDMAVAWPPPAARALGAERHYLPGNVPLVKRVGAAAGDRACALGAVILVNGRRVAVRRSADPAGRPMPWWWHGCRRLRTGEVLLLSPGQPEAFDGRYFGVSSGRQLIGKARLLWPA